MVFVIIFFCLYCIEIIRYEYKNEDKMKYLKLIFENVKIFGMILVILVGFLLCVMLILVIIWEVCFCWWFFKFNGRWIICDDVYVDIIVNWKDVNRMK